MEFAEIIKITRCDRVKLRRPHRPILEGTLCVASHHMILAANDGGGEELTLLHSAIDYVDRKQTGMAGGTLWIKCKDFRILQLDINGADNFARLAETLEDIIRVVASSPTMLYPFFYQPMYSILEDGWTIFQPESEFSRLVQQGDEWRISYVNKEYKVCPSYPSAVVVPKSIDDSDLITISSFRQGGRFPVLAYRHEGGAVLMRSSQPLITQNNRRCREDEKLLNCVLPRDKRGYIIDTRVQHLSQSAKLRGNTVDGDVHYPMWRRVHKPIDRRHHLLDGLTKLVDAINDGSSGTDKWLSRLESSHWMHNIKETLNCACLVAQCLDQDGSPVLVQDAEGLDTCLQVTSLVQIILNPDCRTVRGFEALIEREWIQGGHPFATRHSKGVYTPSSQRNGRKNGPSFLLFLDCVHQIHSQFTCSFEFSEKFLVMLFEHSYFSDFGTFLGDNEGAKMSLCISQNSTSLWSYVNRPEVLSNYINPVYEPNQRVIWPSVAPMSLILWDAIFLRWVVEQDQQEKANETIRILREQDASLRSKAMRLRGQLHDLEREAVALGIIAPATMDQIEKISC